MKVAYRGDPPSRTFLLGLERLIEAEQAERPIDSIVESVGSEDELEDDPLADIPDPRGWYNNSRVCVL